MGKNPSYVFNLSFDKQDRTVDHVWRKRSLFKVAKSYTLINHLHMYTGASFFETIADLLHLDLMVLIQSLKR